MLEAARAAVRFHCPGCGAGLRAGPRAGGTTAECFVCGESVRIPCRPHPRECTPDDLCQFPAPVAATAEAGVRLLLGSLGLTALGYVLITTVVAYWVVASGPAAVLARDYGSLRAIVFTAVAAQILVTLTATGFRWVGYRHCRPAALAVRADGWLGMAQCGLVASAVGCGMAAVPWVGGWSTHTTPEVVRALAEAGTLTALVGAVLEFGILAVWARLLTEFDGQAAYDRVTRYVVTAGVGVVATALAVCLAGMVTVLALRQNGPPPPPLPGPPPRLDFTVVPIVGWYAVLGVVVVAAGFGVVLYVRYYRILMAVREGLTGPR